MLLSRMRDSTSLLPRLLLSNCDQVALKVRRNIAAELGCSRFLPNDGSGILTSVMMFANLEGSKI